VGARESDISSINLVCEGNIMATTPTYPGVYITETASVPHVVAPATTNLTAFVGEFPKGTTSEAVLVTSWAQFEMEFGPLTADSSLAAYAVAQFFLNGGIGAWIVRMAPTDDPALSTLVTQPAVAASAVVSIPLQGAPVMEISANSPGVWGNDLAVEFRASGPASHPDPSHVDLLVYQVPLGKTFAPSPPPAYPPVETITNVQVLATGTQAAPSLDLVARAITSASNYITASVPAASSPPPGGNSWAQLGPNGSDGTWAAPGLWDAVVEVELGDGGRLTQLAPAVFNIMCIPDLALAPATEQQYVIPAAHKFCSDRQAFLLVDPPPPASAKGLTTDTTVDNIGIGSAGLQSLVTWADSFLSPDNVAAATYYPWVQIPDPVTGMPRYVPPSGTVAGVYASTDTSRGVWKAPAGVEALLAGVIQLADTTITDTVNGDLNVMGINCLRTFPLYQSIVWGSRTLAGSDIASSPFKYVPVRRLADFIEQSLQQSLRWAVFEPNAPTLWASVTLEVTAFMAGLFAAGAFAGSSAAQAYTVACNASTTSPTDMLSGIVNVNVGFAPVDPAEFVMLNIQINAASAAS
jgi:phage tail sheath protein FI